MTGACGRADGCSEQSKRTGPNGSCPAACRTGDTLGVGPAWESFAPLRAVRELRGEFDGTIFVLAMGDLVASFGFSLIFPFLTIYLTTELGASAGQAGLILGCYSVASIASNALGGWLADRFGRKVVMVVSIGLTAVVIAAMGQVRDLAWLSALTLLLGIVDPPFIPAARAAVADVVPAERRPRAYGLLGVAASIGWIAGPSIGAGLSVLGYPFLFALAGAILGIYFVILIVGLRETRPGHDASLSPPVDMGPLIGVRPAAEPDSLDAGPGDSAGGAGTVGISGPAGLGPGGVFAAFLILSSLVHAVTFQWIVTLPIHAYRDLGISTATWGLLFALNGILILAFQLRISSASEGRSLPRFMAIGVLAYMAGYLVVAAVPGRSAALPMLAAVVVLVSVGEMFIFPVEPSFVAELSPPGKRGRYQGMLGAALGLGSAIGPPLGGFALDAFPGPPVWLAVAAGAAVAAAGLAWLGGGQHSVDGRIAASGVS